MGKTMWGKLEWELLQPLEGRSIHQDFLDAHGEGLHHLGFMVHDYEEAMEKMAGAGCIPLMRAESRMEMYGGVLKACYFDTGSVGGVICEIIWRSWQTKKG